MGVWRETFCFETNKKIFHCGWYIIMFSYVIAKLYGEMCEVCMERRHDTPKTDCHILFSGLLLCRVTQRIHSLFTLVDCEKKEEEKILVCMCVFWRENDHHLLPPQLIRPVVTQLTNNIDQILREYYTLLTYIYQSKKTHPNKQQRFHHLSF